MCDLPCAGRPSVFAQTFPFDNYLAESGKASLQPLHVVDLLFLFDFL